MRLPPKTDEERLALLDHYHQMEPTIEVNALNYTIAYRMCEDGLVFWAKRPRTRHAEAVILIDKLQFDWINDGMTMCWVYLQVLNHVEMVIQQGEIKVPMAEVSRFCWDERLLE